MSIQSALLAVPHLYDQVAARFLSEGTSVPMHFGWNASAEQLRSTDRVTWIPGDESGALGRVGAPKYPSMDQLRTLFELVTIEITSADESDLTDERRQYQRVRELHDAVLRAIHLSAVGTYAVISDKWKAPAKKQQRRFGQTIRLIIEVQSPITNDALDRQAVTVDQAIIEAYELDHHETITVQREQ